MPAFLFIASVLSWGTTWYAMRVAVEAGPVMTAIFWRFVIAGTIAMALLALSGRLRAPRGSEWFWLVMMALFIFSTNFVIFGYVARMIPSGLVSVLFATATVINAINSRIFFRETIGLRMGVAAMLGLVGVVLMFAPDLAAGLSEAGARTTLLAIGLGILGTLSFSLGNMISRRNTAAGLDVTWVNAWGMCLGVVLLGVATAVSGAGFIPPARADWWIAVTYLAVIGSVLGFAAYLGLVARIGPNKAAYTTVLFPVVALWISWLIEDYHWHLPAIIGLGLVTVGNVLVFTGKRRA